MIEEPMFPTDDSPNDPAGIPPEIENIITQMKLLYFIGGEEVVRTALSEAGVSAAQIEEMISALRESLNVTD